MVIDADQRDQATHPGLSFIVQAPAGSGKTEILTQRYLRLLGRVSAPEQIIALTFTRKAASEMRERIIVALQRAAAKTPAATPHQQRTLDFAQEALKRSRQYQWDLLSQANRLKIMTIDALCQSINQSIPLLEQQIAYPQITDKPEHYYVQAARQCIHFAIEQPPYQTVIKTLLLHVDNRQDHLLHLFANLLGQRDQWLSLLFQARAQEKAQFEQALSRIEQHELQKLRTSLPQTLAEEMICLSHELALLESNLDSKPESPRLLLKTPFSFNQINQELALALSKTLLTGEGQFRKHFDHHVGLKKGVCSDAQYYQLKEASQELLTHLSEYPDFLNALIQVSHLPKPQYDAESWEVLQALFVILPLLVSHLHVLFSSHNEVDFTTISQQAIQALGEMDNPTDLALYLDHSIHHLLLDEFQDTSITQFELISKLVHGWQEGDGKTLFIVGDPMQSIYRFRQAEVGLFFRAKEQGIGPVLLNSLELSCNFRSTETIVHWVNHHFSTVFPKKMDMESGAVPFHPCVHVGHHEAFSQVQAIACQDKKQQAEYLVQILREELALRPDQNLAILVRSRTHLREIIPILREHHIPYQGTDIDLLAGLTHLRDVWSLTQALLFPANRLCWLSALRSPYCGLSLEDLHSIAHYDQKKSIYESLLHLDQIENISPEGRLRAAFFIQVMTKALAQRHQESLVDWVVQTLKALQVDQILTSEQFTDLDQLWLLLDRYEQEGLLPDMSQFLEQLSRLYAQQASPSPIKIMTIHKSKGLEFDTVLLPEMGASPHQADAPMLRWLKLPTQNHGNLLLLSPIQAAHQENCPLYQYLKRIDEEKNHYEAQRLLYVAATRAKSRLYLMDSSSKASKGSFRSLLLHQEFVEQGGGDFVSESSYERPLLSKLPLDYYKNPCLDIPQFLNEISPSLSLEIPRATGIITHKLLQWICEYHPQNLNEIPWELVHNELQSMGLGAELQESLCFGIRDQVTRMFQDPIGFWILSKQTKEKNEYELMVKVHNQLATRIIDRSFEEDGKLWIIDFKTGKEDQQTLAKQYEQQLNEYAYHMSSRTQLPIYCGIYYLENNHWVSWIAPGRLGLLSISGDLSTPRL